MDFLPNEKEDPISSYMFCIRSHFQLDIFLSSGNKTNIIIWFPALWSRTWVYILTYSECGGQCRIRGFAWYFAYFKRICGDKFCLRIYPHGPENRWKFLWWWPSTFNCCKGGKNVTSFQQNLQSKLWGNCAANAEISWLDSSLSYSLIFSIRIVKDQHQSNSRNICHIFVFPQNGSRR